MRYINRHWQFRQVSLGICICAASLIILFTGVRMARAQSIESDDSFTTAAVYLQAINIDLRFEDTSRTTDINSIDFVLREPLTDRLDGALLFGYLNTRQNDNPIFTGQDLAGEYLGLDLRIHLINRLSFGMFTRLAYRYNEVSADIADQTVEWSWHQAELGMEMRTALSGSLFLNLGGEYITINGVEKATGTLNQNLDFKEEYSLTGHIGLQLTLDQTGLIGVEFKTGSIQGGRLIFQRHF